jgi:hypothetical protein
MLTIEQTKKLLNNPAITDEEAEKIRDDSRMLAELIFEAWLTKRKNKKLPNNENEDEKQEHN